MGLFIGLFKAFKRANLLNLQKLVVQNSPDELIYSEAQLLKMTNSIVNRETKIAYDCEHLIDTTIKPKVFFERFDLLYFTLFYLGKFEPYIKFEQYIPSKRINTLDIESTQIIDSFLKRYVASIDEAANNMKTAKGKMNKYQKFYDSLQPYYYALNDEHKQFIENVYQSSINKLK